MEEFITIFLTLFTVLVLFSIIFISCITVFKQWYIGQLLKHFTKLLDVNRNEPVAIIFLGDNEVQINETGKPPINLQYD